MSKILSSEITPEHLYINRREFIKTAGLLSAGTLLSACVSPPEQNQESQEPIEEIPTSKPIVENYLDELGDNANSYEDITNFNNYYEFSMDKVDVASLSKDFITTPWSVTVDGMVNNPKVFDIDDLRSNFTQEERIYRLRCVEGWSMVIPWLGFPLAELLKDVQPTSDAKYVKFTSILDSDQMPGQRSPWYDWPYVEGLRLDEAMNNLTLMATGLYGNDLPNPNGAPIRLVVPWKYGFKSIKAIVRIELVDYKPTSLWMMAAPNEYGFYSNVNPDVPHPRWSQATERRIGEFQRRPTLPFNGYAEEVAHLYEGMDLSKHNA